MVWGWIIAMIFIQCIAMSMAELCSAMPTRYVIVTRLKSLWTWINLTSIFPVADSTMLQLFSRPQAGAP